MSTACLTGSGTISIPVEEIQISDAPGKQFENVVIYS